MANQKLIHSKALAALMSIVLMAAGCTKQRDPSLPEAEALQIFALSEFAGPTSQGFTVRSKPIEKDQTDLTNTAFQEKGLVALDAEHSALPERLKFMFANLEISGQSTENYQIVFGVDSKFVTIYKAVKSLETLSTIDQQLAVSADEVQLAIDLNKASDQNIKNNVLKKMALARKARTTALQSGANLNILVPLFQYEVLGKGVLERTKNELKETTSALGLTETEFSKATHIKIKTKSEDRKDITSPEQKKALDQIFKAESIDNKITKASDLEKQLNINMKFVTADSTVLTKLDAADLKVFELTTMAKLSKDEQRQVTTNSANGEIIKCSDVAAAKDLAVKDNNCLLRLVARVPVSYKKLALNLIDSKNNSTNTVEFRNVSKSESKGLVEIVQQVAAERARPTGIMDPIRTLKISELQGEFYFRRTFENGSNMMMIGKAGTSGDMSIIKFEFENDRLVVRNLKALIQYVGQGPKDREELMSIPVKYFNIESTDPAGVALQVPRLIEASKDDAQYLEIDWTRNTIPISNSPLAFFDAGECWMAETSQQVSYMDMRLSKDGMLSFSLAGSYTVKPECANQNSVSENAQFNYNVIERISFKKRTDTAVEDKQFAPNVPLSAQSAMNFAIFTMAESNTDPSVRPGRENSVINRPIIHDFRNGKVLNYWVGGLAETKDPNRRTLIEEAAKEVVDEWNSAFRKAFEGDKTLERSGDYIVLHKEDDASRGHLGDLDKNYLWFMDMPTENGLLGVAQFAPNPYSGNIIANNVIVYSGNSETEVRSFMASYKESRAYEKILEAAKNKALEDFQKQEAADKEADALERSKSNAASAYTSATVSEKMSKLAPTDRAHFIINKHNSFIKKLVLSARVPLLDRMSSKYSIANRQKSAWPNKMLRGLSKNQFESKQMSEINLKNNFDYTSKIITEALSGDFKNDPLMLEAIIAREVARSKKGLSPEIRAVLLQKARMNEMSAKFDQNAKKRGGCFMYSRNEYNDKFVESDFNTLFKKEIKATLLHEVGHALGLRHNFKASYDKKNFNFAGENTNRNYTSIMDYIASPEMEYEGPGTYDVHALRAIYTNRIEVSDAVKNASFSNINGAKQYTSRNSNTTVNLASDKYVSMEEVKSLLGFTHWSDMQKNVVDASNLLRHYSQCHDELVGVEPACQLYDEGASATEIVKNEIQNYNRSYALSYSAADRIHFGWNEKIGVMRRTLTKFKNIRSVLEETFSMAFNNSARNQQEIEDFLFATQIGGAFFHEVILTPDTNLPLVNSEVEIAKRLSAFGYVLNSPVLDSKGKPEVDVNGKAKTVNTNAAKLLEARNVNDGKYSTLEDRFDTLGIGFDKQIALKFLMTATPVVLNESSSTAWFSYLELEKFFFNIKDPQRSANMMTIFEIMNNNLNGGFYDENLVYHLVPLKIEVPKDLHDTAILSSLVDTNLSREKGFDAFAEFFKVGTLKGGKTVTDRPVVMRMGQNNKSAMGIRFFGADNAKGGGALVRIAAKKQIIEANREPLKQRLLAINNADNDIAAKALELINTDPRFRGKTQAEVIASAPEVQALIAASNKASLELENYLISLNQNEALFSKDEIAVNPNLAPKMQVLMAKNLYKGTMGTLVALISSMAELDYNEDMIIGILQDLQKIGSQSKELANTEFLALTEDILFDLSKKMAVQFKGGKKVEGSIFMEEMVGSNNLTGSYVNIMSVIEDLANYTSILNPEYVY